MKNINVINVLKKIICISPSIWQAVESSFHLELIDNSGCSICSLQHDAAVVCSLPNRE